MKEFAVQGKDEGKRLDRFMEEQAGWPRSLLMKALRKKKLKVNGKNEDPSYRLSREDRIVSFLPEQKRDPDFSVVYEDDQILIVDKKAGILCMDITGRTKHTLIDEVNEYLREKNEKPAYMVHRIDFHTSGLMVIAKTEESKKILDRLFETGGIRKTYLCTVLGEMKNKSGKLVHYLFKDAKQNRVFLSSEPVKGAKTAVTEYKVKQIKDGLSLVECRLLTGRTHQIRSQMAHIGYPLLGDDKYGKKKINKSYGEKGQLLCAWRLSFQTEEGLLAYLNEKSFTVSSVPFQKKYFS